jgi:hypothetical protein
LCEFGAGFAPLGPTWVLGPESGLMQLPNEYWNSQLEHCLCAKARRSHQVTDLNYHEDVEEARNNERQMLDNSEPCDFSYY